jgi:hypothetical protein
VVHLLSWTTPGWPDLPAHASLLILTRSGSWGQWRCRQAGGGGSRSGRHLIGACQATCDILGTTRVVQMVASLWICKCRGAPTPYASQPFNSAATMALLTCRGTASLPSSGMASKQNQPSGLAVIIGYLLLSPPPRPPHPTPPTHLSIRSLRRRCASAPRAWSWSSRAGTQACACTSSSCTTTTTTTNNNSDCQQHLSQACATKSGCCTNTTTQP